MGNSIRGVDVRPRTFDLKSPTYLHERPRANPTSELNASVCGIRRQQKGVESVEDNKCATKSESQNLFTNLASQLSETRKISGAGPRQAPEVRRKRLAVAAKRPQVRFAAQLQIAVTLTLGQLTHSNPSLTLAATSEVNPNPSFPARP